MACFMRDIIPVITLGQSHHKSPHTHDSSPSAPLRPAIRGPKAAISMGWPRCLHIYKRALGEFLSLHFPADVLRVILRRRATGSKPGRAVTYSLLGGRACVRSCLFALSRVHPKGEGVQAQAAGPCSTRCAPPPPKNTVGEFCPGSR